MLRDAQKQTSSKVTVRCTTNCRCVAKIKQYTFVKGWLIAIRARSWTAPALRPVPVLHVRLGAAVAAAAQPPDLVAGTLLSAVLQNSNRAV